MKSLQILTCIFVNEIEDASILRAMRMMFSSVLTIVVFIVFVRSDKCPDLDLIERSFADVHIPGGAIVVVSREEILYQKSIGYHSLSPLKPVNVNNSIFTLASLSKPFIGIAVMQLVEENVLNLDEDINTYLNQSYGKLYHPRYPSDLINLRHLLSHTSSISVDDNFLINSMQSDDLAFDNLNLMDFSFDNLIDKPSNWLEYPPGSRTKYSNEGTTLAALIVEQMSNMSYEKYVREKILKPLNINLKKTSFRLNDIEKRDDIVEQYAYLSNSSDDDQWKEGLSQLNLTKLSSTYPTFLHIPFFSFSVYPAGLLRATIKDLSKFVQMFMNDGYPLLHSSSINQMKRVVGDGHIPSADSSQPSPQFGLIWNWRILPDGRRVIGHRGTLSGSTHLMMINEDNTIGVLILTNADINIKNGISIKIDNLLIDTLTMLFGCFPQK